MTAERPTNAAISTETSERPEAGVTDNSSAIKTAGPYKFPSDDPAAEEQLKIGRQFMAEYRGTF